MVISSYICMHACNLLDFIVCFDFSLLCPGLERGYHAWLDMKSDAPESIGAVNGVDYVASKPGMGLPMHCYYRSRAHEIDLGPVQQKLIV